MPPAQSCPFPCPPPGNVALRCHEVIKSDLLPVAMADLLPPLVYSLHVFVQSLGPADGWRFFRAGDDSDPSLSFARSISSGISSRLGRLI